MENPTYKEMFFGCPNHERKCVLLTLMSRPKNLKKCGIFWPTLVLEWIMLFWQDSLSEFFLKRYLFAFLDNIYFVENKYVMCEFLYNIEIYITCFLNTIKFSFSLNQNYFSFILGNLNVNNSITFGLRGMLISIRNWEIEMY